MIRAHLRASRRRLLIALALGALAVSGCTSTRADIGVLPDGSPSPATASQPSQPSGSASGDTEPELVGFAITNQTRDDLDKYLTFEYQTATTTGLTPDAAARADSAISESVTAAVAAAAAANRNDCGMGEDQCGIFTLTLKPFKCADPYLCLKQTTSGVPIGAATGDEQVKLVIIDPTTGNIIPTDEIVPTSDKRRFLAAVNRAVYRFQKKNDLFDPYMPTPIKEDDIAAVAPIRSGVRVWLNKYAAGPGAVGVVALTVPKPQELTSTDTAPVWGPQLPVEAGDMLDYLCWGDAARLPNLPSDDGSGASTVQTVLTTLGYDAGPVDGDYGPLTQSAVRAYQKDQGLAVDGNVGQQTWTRIREMFCWQYEEPDPIDYENDAPETTTGNQQGQTQNLTTVPNLIGQSNRNVPSIASSAGLRIGFTKYTTTDPSIAAITNGQCPVIEQSPSPGQQVLVGTAVNILLDCPMTGQTPVGGYTGPAPPPAWTGQ